MEKLDQLVLIEQDAPDRTGDNNDEFDEKCRNAAGDGPAGDQITMVFPTLTLAVPQVRSGKVRALAVTSAKRAAAFPDIPTMREAGYAAVNATSWFGLVAPAQAPKAILNRISVETAKVVKLADVRERIEAQHGEVVGSTPGEFAKFVAGEIASWTRVAKAGNIRAD